MYVDREWLRFWKRVAVSPGGCWLWAGKTSKGYGRFWSIDGSRTVAAHRWLYERAVGPIPEGAHLDHRCLVKTCVNPEHLEPVTVKENVRRHYGSFDTDPSRCRYGHPLEGDNLYVTPRGHSTCRECRRRSVERNERKRGLRQGPRNEAKTECPQGHPLSGDNLYATPEGRRACKTCRRETLRKSRREARKDPAALAALRAREAEYAREARDRKRGKPPAKPNAEKTHCPQGHPYQGDNVRVIAGSRRCVTCLRETSARAYARRKLAP